MSLQEENTTIFEKILDGSVDCKKVYEDKDVLAFEDINPQAPVHILVIPKKKGENLNCVTQWDDREVAAFLKSLPIVADNLGVAEKGYRVVINCGEIGGQEVPYLHAHILGGRMLKWPPG